MNHLAESEHKQLKYYFGPFTNLMVFYTIKSDPFLLTYLFNVYKSNIKLFERF